MIHPEAIREERHGKAIYRSLMVKGAISVARLLVTSAGDVRRLRQPRASEQRYVRPRRRYELPAYEEGMLVCRTNERYLRPTRYCNSRAPDVVALANALGAYRKPDREVAQAAFEFTKEQMVLEILPIDSVEQTLRRGTGTCFQLISAFIALCRAAGIPARYKMYATHMIQAWQSAVIDVDPLVKKWYDSLGYFLIEGEGEAYMDGQWVVAHVGPTAERQAAAGIPITRFGEDALGIWFFARPGTLMRLEAIPTGLAIGTHLLQKIAPGSMERVNVSIQNKIERGRRIIEGVGGLAAYDELARRKEPASAPNPQV
jgi:hypothetical protein